MDGLTGTPPHTSNQCENCTEVAAVRGMSPVQSQLQLSKRLNGCIEAINGRKELNGGFHLALKRYAIDTKHAFFDYCVPKYAISQVAVCKTKTVISFAVNP